MPSQRRAAFEVSDAGSQRRVVVGEPGYARVARIGACSGGPQSGQSLLELLFEVGVGAVERGAGDTGFDGEGLDVALASGRDGAVEQAVGCGADPGFGLLALVFADSHFGLSFGLRAASAVSIA
jgi:hypothetical protein